MITVSGKIRKISLKKAVNNAILQLIYCGHTSARLLAERAEQRFLDEKE